MKKTVKFLAVLFWMAMIFFFSAQNAEQSGNMSSGLIVKIAELVLPGNLTSSDQHMLIAQFSFILRKTAHFSVYLVLGILVLNFLKEFRLKHILVIALIICCFYSISDEYHQTFVPGRSGEVRDVCIDTAGAFTGISIGELVLYVLSERKKNK